MPSRTEITDAPKAVAAQRNQFAAGSDPSYGRGVAEGLGLKTEDVLNGELATVDD